MLLLAGVGAIASGINAVAGGGSLISFPALIFTLPHSHSSHFDTPAERLELDKIANATNSVALWPGSLAGAFGFLNLLKSTGHHFKTLFVPTILGSLLGGWLLIATREKVFSQVVPWLILLAAALLVLQPRIKAFVVREHEKLPTWVGIVLQFLVALYGGYFGAGMGIMMLAAFALYMEGNVHELNAVKNWLGLLINFSVTVLFIVKGLVLYDVALALTAGSVVGGFVAARVSQKLDPDRLRLAIAVYGFGMAALFFYRAFVAGG